MLFTKYKYFFALVICFCLLHIKANAQQIIYSEKETNDIRIGDFKVIGKVKQNYWVYKLYRNQHYISLYNTEMQLAQTIDLTPLSNNLIDVDFLAYSQHVYAFYRYRKAGTVYFMAARFNAEGKRDVELTQIDTYEDNFVNSEISFVLTSSLDKSKICLAKLYKRENKSQKIETFLYNNQMQLLQQNSYNLPMNERNSFCNNFQLDNAGNIYFLKLWGSSELVTKIVNYQKPFTTDTLISTTLETPENTYLDDIHTELDEANKQLHIVGLYSKKRRGDVEGIMSCTYNNVTTKASTPILTELNTEFRAMANQESSGKTALNDFYIKQIIPNKDAGFIICMQHEYHTTANNNYNNFNRWDFYGGGFGNRSYGYYSPFNNYYSPYNYNNSNKYYANNVAVIAFDKNTKMTWSNAIYKQQYNDNNSHILGYSLFNSGSRLNFIFNAFEKRAVYLDNQSITPTGSVTKPAILKNLDKGYDFLPKYALQVSSKQIIIPCIYKNYLCFAKLEF